MDLNELTEEQKTKLKSCKDATELKAMLDTMGIKLSDEQLEAASGGINWDVCPSYVPGCAFLS